MGIFGALFGKVKIQESGKKFCSIAGAIDAASDGDTILVSSGVYQESFEINKKIRIVGDAANKPVIWAETQKPQNVITVTADCSLENFEIRGAKDQRPDAPKSVDGDGDFLCLKPSCIFVKSSCKLTNVDVCFSAGFGIACIVEKTVLEMDKCSVHSNKDQAIIFDDRVGGVINDTRIYNNEGSGICCRSKSYVKLQNCTITENYDGVMCGDAALDAEQCEITNNHSAGVNLSYGVKASAKSCVIRGNKLYGIECESTSVASFVECEICDSEYGIFCKEGFALTIQDCNIHDMEKKEITIVKDSVISDIQSVKNVNAATEKFVRL